jgi:two-component system, response regulator PdtaR
MTLRGAATMTTVLLMENKPAVRTNVATALKEAGFDVVQADNIPDAWNTLETRPEVRVLVADLEVTTQQEG